MSDREAHPLRVDRLPLDEQPGELVVLTLDRPAAMNAIDNALLADLHTALAEIETAANARGVVVAAAGERAFSAGMDLKERAGFSDDDLRTQRAGIVGLIGRLHELPVPTVAAVDGVALGGGFELALACDLIVAGAGATFGLPEVKVGIFPGGGSTQTLTWLVGPARTRDVILTGRRLSATEAEAWGVVARVVEAGTARDEAVGAGALDRRGRADRHPPGEGGDPRRPPVARRRPRRRERAVRGRARVRRPARGVQRVRGEAPAAVHRPLAAPDVDLGRGRHAAPAGRLLPASRGRGPGDRPGAGGRPRRRRSRRGRREASGSSAARSTGRCVSFSASTRPGPEARRRFRAAEVRVHRDVSRAATTAACWRDRSPPR